MKRILCIVPELGTGGLERVMITLANNIDRSRFSFTIMVLKPGFDSILDQLKDDVKVVQLGITGKLRYRMGQVIRAIRREKPDILYSTSNGLNAQMAPWVVGLRIFNGIRSVARVVIILSLRYGKRQYRLFSKLHNAYDSVIVQSEDMLKDLVKGGTKECKTTVISNPVDVKRIQASLNGTFAENQLPKGKYNLITAGRLSAQKNFSTLIERVQENRDKGIHLTILGEGEDRYDLEKLIKDLDCTECITLAGYQPNPYIYMKQADLYVLSSHFEGFPNALLEAFICGLPVLSNNCPGGINEIVREGVNGYLCNIADKSSFSEKLELCRKASFDLDLIQTSTEQRYGVPVIIQQYEKIFEKL